MEAVRTGLILVTLFAVTSTLVLPYYKYVIGLQGIRQACRTNKEKSFEMLPQKNLIKISIIDLSLDKKDCKWLLDAPDGMLVRIYLEWFSLSYPGHLIARDGPNETAVLLHNFTQNSPKKFWWVTSTRYLWVHFKADNQTSDYNTGFRVFVEFVHNIKACGPSVDSSRFDKLSFTSPFYPHAYPNGQSCRWEISPRTFVYIRLKFKELDLADGDVIKVGLKIIISNNMTSLIVNKWITPCYHGCSLKFMSDGQLTAKGFSVDINTDEYQPIECQESRSPYILEKGEDTINSPFYPEYNPSYARCKWIASAPLNHIIGLKLTDFDLAPGHYLEISDKNGTTLKTFSTKPRLDIWWTFNKGYQMVYFESSAGWHFLFKGFQMKVKYTSKNTACLPNVIKINSSARSLSPYNGFYFNNQRCTWLITAPQHQIIRFWFPHFDLVLPEDYLEVHDGVNESSAMVRNLTAHPNIKERWVSSSNNLLIRFVSNNDHMVATGFNLTWTFYNKTRACSHLSPEIVTSGTEPIQSPFYPEYYSNNQECKWLVSAPSKYYVAFFLSLFRLADGDYLEVRDGKNEEAPMLKKFTKETKLSRELFKSTGRFLWLKFKSDYEHVGEGFRMVIMFQFKNTETYIPKQHPTVAKIAETQEPNGFEDNSQASSNWVLGTGLGSGFLILVVLIVVAVIIKKRKKNNKKKSKHINEPWEICLDQVELLEEIGQGAFGKVFKGQIELPDTDEVQPSSKKACPKLKIKKKCNAAIKTLRDKASAQEKSDFLDEIEFMKNVGRHKNVISMLACCTKEDQAFLVVEYAQHGDLLHLLKKKRNRTYVRVHSSSANESSDVNPDETGTSDNMESLLEEFVSYSWQIAKGMEYLSSKEIVHRDLAARNVLVAEGLVAKVADFGLSRNMTYATKLYQASTSRRLPLRWMSPEALTEQIFTVKSDVWSYGVVLWEIFSFGKLPYHTLYNEQLTSFLRNGDRMEKPELCAGELFELMLHCWKENPDDRPSFSDVINSLETFMTRDTPYVEMIEMTALDDGYMVPLDSGGLDSDGSDVIQQV